MLLCCCCGWTNPGKVLRPQKDKIYYKKVQKVQQLYGLHKNSADFTFLPILATISPHFHVQYDIFACSGPSLGWSNHSNSKSTSSNFIATFCGSQLWKNSTIFDNFCNFSFFLQLVIRKRLL